MKTGLVLDELFLEHKTASGHPERAERISAIRDKLQSTKLIERCQRIAPQKAELKWILKNHSKEYLERLKNACDQNAAFIDTPDSVICPASFEIARYAVGSVLSAIDLVQSRELKNAFCAVRPPGHHAEKELSMGFCLFNNVAIAAYYLMAAYNIQRILIFDWDVHHGNGTQHSFERDPRVLFCSMHGHPQSLYPGTGFPQEQGLAEGLNYTINIAMPPKADDLAYRIAFEQQARPRFDEFAPEFILISAGFDAHKDDPVGNTALASNSFEWLSQEMLSLADKHCQGKLVSILEGGYNLEVLAESVYIHLESLILSERIVNGEIS